MKILWTLMLLAMLASPLKGAILLTLPIRYMTVGAEQIVVGTPVDPEAATFPMTFKLTEVLKGPPELLQQEVTILGGDLYSLSPPQWFSQAKTQRPVKVAQALLFLRKPSTEQQEQGYYPVVSGIRILSHEGVVLVPTQQMNPGPFYFEPDKGVKWQGMLEQVRSDLPKIARIRELETIDDFSQRNQAIFAWIEKHKHEFGKNSFDRGWGPLRQEVFDWIMVSGIPTDCWKAVTLAKELNTSPKVQHSSFCSSQGRLLLLEKVFDPALSTSLRLTALRELGNGSNFWSPSGTSYPEAKIVTPEEQSTIIDHILPLLKHEDSHWRTAAVQCLTSASWPYGADMKDLISKRAVPQLVELYRNEKDEEVKRALIDALRRIEDETFWQELTENPQGIVVFATYKGIADEALTFNLNLDHTRVTITELPTFGLQKVRDDGTLDDAIVLQPTLKYPLDLFARGWNDWQGLVLMTIPQSQIAPGKWCVTVRGKIGQQTWRSEAVYFSVPLSED